MVEVFVSTGLALCAPSRDASFASAVNDLGAGPPAVAEEKVLGNDGCAGITMLDSGFVSLPLGIAGDETGIGLPSADGVAKTGAAISGGMLGAGTLVCSHPVRNSSGATETGGSTSVVGASADAIPIADPPAGSYSSAGEADAILVNGCAGIPLVAMPFAAVPFGRSGDESRIGLPSADGVAKTGAAISGGMLGAGTLVCSHPVRDSSGATETARGTSAVGATADAIPIADPAAGSNSSSGEEPVMADASPTAGSGSGGRKAGNGGVSRIFPFLSGITPAAGAGVSGVRLGEELGDFAGFFGLPFAVPLPRSISPMAFVGFSEVSCVLLVASAKAVENFSDGATPPRDAFAGITFTATGGKLTITVSP